MPILYWKKRSEDTWHKLSSSYPITYTREQDAPPYQGGQCPILYRVSASGWYNRSWRWGWNTNDIQIVGPLGDIRYYIQGYGYGVYIRTGSGSYQAISGSTSSFYEYGLNWIDIKPWDSVRTDNCGNLPSGNCTTYFYSNGYQILSVADTTCVEISNAPNECECCGQMLPIANRILAGLSS